MGKAQRDKGARGERELADLIGAEKVSGMYREGRDLTWKGLSIEVKRRASVRGFGLPASLVGGIGSESELVALRADRGDWLICCTTEVLALVYALGMKEGREQEANEWAGLPLVDDQI
jgi:hypothetical protein